MPALSRVSKKNQAVRFSRKCEASDPARQPEHHLVVVVSLIRKCLNPSTHNCTYGMAWHDMRLVPLDANGTTRRIEGHTNQPRLTY